MLRPIRAPGALPEIHQHCSKAFHLADRLAAVCAADCVAPRIVWCQ